MKKHSSIALVTVTDSDFLVGTQVLLHSFLKFNTWFQGDIIVYHDSLSLKEQNSLGKMPNLHFKTPGSELQSRLKILGSYWNYAARVYRRFFSLDVFNLSQYDQILFLDSDILCQSSVAELLQHAHSPIVAVPDAQSFLGKKRDPVSFMPCCAINSSCVNDCFMTFNSGMMLVNSPLLKDNCHEDLLKQLNPLIFKEVKSGHTVQYLLNRYFRDNVDFVSPKYNYLLNANEHLGISLKEAVFIHYIQSNKPWKAETNEGPNKIWRDLYEEYLKK